MNSIVQSFENMKVMILGDMMLDTYVYGHVCRISPEAPVPVLNMERREARLGGAGNVALNLKSLGAESILFSVIGQDENSAQMLRLLEQAGIDSSGIILSPHRKTTVKTRFIGNQMQMLRLDEEISNPLLEEDEKQLLRQLLKRVQKGDIRAIIFVYYDKGVLTETGIKSVIELAHQYNIITTVDPKLKNFNHYKGVTLFKPNRKELYKGLQKRMGIFSWEEIEKNMQQFANQQDIKLMMVTLSEYGIVLYERETGKFEREAAHLRHISDVSGAGDTVIAVATLALCAGMQPGDIMRLANLAGGIVCEYAGVVPITREKLLN
jgi:rfaE bifunctional protein kinase chain/domain